MNGCSEDMARLAEAGNRRGCGRGVWRRVALHVGHYSPAPHGAGVWGDGTVDGVGSMEGNDKITPSLPFSALEGP